MKIQVTAERIARGVPRELRQCPVAISIHETLPEFDDVQVLPCDGSVRIYLVNDDRQECRLHIVDDSPIIDDKDLYDLICQYDKDPGTMAPFEFELPSYKVKYETFDSK